MDRLCLGSVIRPDSINGPGIWHAVRFQCRRNRFRVLGDMVRLACVHGDNCYDGFPRSAGSVIGFGANFYQESLYKLINPIMFLTGGLNHVICRKHVARVGDEARLFSACVAGITFVIGSMIYAWTSYKYIHWIAPSIGITIIIASIFAIFLSVFNYIADSTLIRVS